MNKTALITGASSGIGKATAIGIRFLFTMMSTSPEKSAETSIYLATSPEVEKVSGKYFEKKKEVKTGKNANNEADNKRLWEVSMKLAKLN